MTKHSNDNISCPSCNQKLTQAHPLIALYFKKIRENFIDCHIACTFRDKTNQDEAVASGKSLKVWPTSAHNIIEAGRPRARAFDFFKQDHGTYQEPIEWITEVVKFCKIQQMPFRYGLDFKEFHDAVHIELLGSVP